MKKNVRIPTVLGIIVLIAGIIAGTYLINSNQIFRLKANIEAMPKDVRFSNITDNNITVSWTTDVESVGFVKWGNSENSLNKVALEENSGKSYVHSANIIGAMENSNIFIKINSENKDYDNNGISWQTKTLATKVLLNNKLVASGVILKSDGSNPAKAIVYLTINGTVFSSLTSDKGSYVIPVNNFIGNTSETATIELAVNAGVNGNSQAIIYPKSIKSIPIIILGKTYDFRSLPQTDESTSPQSTLSVPESITVSSRFEIQKTETATNPIIVTVDSIKDGEIINTINPEFFGKGPKDTDIQVEVQSELQQAAVVTDAKGLWSWSPPNNLEPGEHKVIIKWRDANGILRSITRNFIVQASEGPAFESTPSATPINTATSTPISTSSATPRVTKTPTTTAPPTPETGSLTPTIGLFIMGIGILLSSIFVWNKSYA